jgi:hypothetical protein
MIGLAVSVNNVFWTAVYLLVIVPIMIAAWMVIGAMLSMFLGPLGYFCAFVMMFYYWRHF